MLGSGGAAELLRSPHLLCRRKVVATRCIRPLQSLFNAYRRKRSIGSFIREIEFLPRRKSDSSRQEELLFGIVVTDDNELLLPGLKFYICAQRIDGRDDARGLLIVCFVVKRLGSLNLCLCGIHPGCSGNGEQILIAGGKHHQLASVLVVVSRGRFIRAGAALALNGMPVK